MPAWLYILRLPTGVLCLGSTSDLASRLLAHRVSHGSGETTRGLRPASVVWVERFDCLSAARLREAQLKRWSRAKKEALVARDTSRLRQLARRRLDGHIMLCVASIAVHEEGRRSLDEYARIPSSFEVRRVLDVESHGDRAGFRLVEHEIAVPYTKDYDDGNDASPAHLPARFDLSNWGVLSAYFERRRVGGMILAFDTPDIDMLEGRRDLVLVWDLRVSRAHRRQGIGTALWRAAEVWAAARRCRRLKVETQNVNAPACRFYARQGCSLGVVHRDAYPTHPGETQLLWYKDLESGARID